MGQQPVAREEETNWSVGGQGLTIPLCFIAIHQHTIQQQGPKEGDRTAWEKHPWASL